MQDIKFIGLGDWLDVGSKGWVIRIKLGLLGGNMGH